MSHVLTHTEAAPHRDARLSLHARRSFVSPLRGSLVLIATSCGSGPTYVEGSAFLYTKIYPANVAPHTHARSAADMARLCRAFCFVPYAGAKRRVKFRRKPDTSFLYARAQHGGKKVRLRTLLSPRTGILLSPRLSPAPKPGSSSGAASLSVPPFSSGAPHQSAGIAPGHLEKGPVRLLRAAAGGAACRVLQFVLSRHSCLSSSKPHLRCKGITN